MPGVNVTTNVRSGPSAGAQPPSGQFFLVGVFERGSTTEAVRVRSVAELNRYFGTSQTYSAGYDQAVTFFNEGGNQAIIARVVGDDAEVGTLQLMDNNADTPAATLTVNAANPGAWSNNLTVQISAGPTANTYRMTVRLNGAIVEDYNNLTSPDDAVIRFSGSPYVEVVNAGSTSTAPANNPKIIAATAVAAGDDDRASLTADDYIAALDRFSPAYGDGAVAIPGQTGSSVFTALINHAKNNNRIALLASARGASVANLQADVASLNSEYAGLFAPWVLIPGANAITPKAISPEGYVAAVRARAHAQVGPWRSPAGAFAQANYVLDVDQAFDTLNANLLDDSRVSVIRQIQNSVRLYGWRSLSTDTDNWAMLKDRDTLNRLVVDANDRLEEYVFSVIDGQGILQSKINAELVGMLDPISQAGGLFAQYDNDGNEIDPGYVVDTSSTINPLSTLSQGIVNATIAVRISPTGSLINLVITKAGLLTSLVA
jgi:phage tail sheath protein FI